MNKVRKIEKINPLIKTIPIVNLDSKPAPEPMDRFTFPLAHRFLGQTPFGQVVRASSFMDWKEIRPRTRSRQCSG